MHATQIQAPELVSPAQTLRHAARYLAWAGWHQGDYYTETPDPTPPADVVGAIAMAVYGHRVATPHCEDLARLVMKAEEVLRDFLRTRALDAFPPHDYIGGLSGLDYRDTEDLHDLYDWNDAPWQTRKNVIETLEAAAEDYDRTPGGAA